MSVRTTASDTQPDAGRVVFELAGITKRFGATLALAGVSLQVRAGEFVALLGPNGAGKSTLIKVLDGVERPDEGSVFVSPYAGGMGIVHQDLGLVGTLTIAENVFLGRTGPVLLLADEVRQTREALASVGLPDLDPHRLVDELRLGERTMVAVAKLFSRGDRIIIIDEVTAGLPPSEAEWLVARLRNAARQGATVMMVTHRLGEVHEVADRYVVMVDGAVAMDEDSSKVTHDDLVRVMSSGRHTASSSAGIRRPAGRGGGSVVCTLRAARCERAGPVDLEIEAGQIVGLTGLVGSGLHEVAYMAAGLERPLSGRVEVPKGTRRRCVPAHRESEGVFAEDTEEFNLTAGVWRRWRRRGLIDVRSMRGAAELVAHGLQLRPPDLEMQVGRLSGGNQQKTVLGRAMIDEPQLLVLCEPTRGVDVATRQEIYAQVRAAADRGTAVFVASSDIEDLTSLAEVIGVMTADGRIRRWVENDEHLDISALATELM